jgi:hypothetical protein
MSTSTETTVIPASDREHFDATERTRAELREAVTAVDAQLGHLPGASPAASNGLAAAWANLVKLMNLGDEPAVRPCPTCGNIGMRAATRCGRCWATLVPPPLVASQGEPHGAVTQA